MDNTNSMVYDDAMEEDTSSRLPLKNHISRLDMMLQQLQSDLEYSKKLKQQIRSDIVVCSEVNSGFMDELNNFVYDETKRLQLDLVESNELQNEQHLFLKQQTDQVNQDRIKLQQSVIVLENRVEEAEKEFGFI